MSVVRAQNRRRWSVVVVVVAVAVLCALPAVIAAIPVGPIRIALPVLAARIAASAGQPYQGYAIATGSSGLPDLPEFGDITSLFNGDTSLRIWYGSPHRWRVDTLTTAGERDIYQADDAQTVWDSGTSQLTTVVGTIPARFPRGSDLAPPDLARRLLAAAVPGTTAMSPRPARRVGGIGAAGLRLAPADPGTTIGAVDIWADPRTGLPVEVDVIPAGAAKPILVSRMLEVSTTAPDPASTTVPRAHAGIGSVVTSAPDVVSVIRNLDLDPLPDTLAGMPRIDHGLDGLPGIAAYGVGFREVVAVSVYGRTAFDAMNAASAAGAVTATDEVRFAIVTSPLLDVLVLTAVGHLVRLRSGADRLVLDVGGDPYTVIVAGFVTPDVLKQVASSLTEPS